MNNSRRSGAEAVPLSAGASKRVILSMGGKGGVGKTSVMAGLAEWFNTNQIPVQLLDLDTENKARGSLGRQLALLVQHLAYLMSQRARSKWLLEEKHRSVQKPMSNHGIIRIT